MVLKKKTAVKRRENGKRTVKRSEEILDERKNRKLAPNVQTGIDAAVFRHSLVLTFKNDLADSKMVKIGTVDVVKAKFVQPMFAKNAFISPAIGPYSQ